MHIDKIAWNQIPNKSNIERWNQRKNQSQNNLKKIRVKKKNQTANKDF